MAWLHASLILIALYLWATARNRLHPDSPEIGPVPSLVVLLLLSPLTVAYLRALRRVRWLDPKSLPEEWEPPGYQDLRRRR